MQDARFQQLMPDVLHWLGIRRIDRLMSMSNMKYDAIIGSGIEVVERVPIPEGLVPPDAQVELEAKKAAGYYTPEGAPGRRRTRQGQGPGPGAVLTALASLSEGEALGDRPYRHSVQRLRPLAGLLRARARRPWG